MAHPLDRRIFLKHSLTGLAAAALSPACTLRSTQDPAAKPLFQISLAQWSLHRRLQGHVQPKLDALDFAATSRRLGIGAIEYVNQFFKDKATNRAYLGELAKRANDAGVKSLLIMCDGEGHIGAPDEQQRARAIENHHKWVEAAASLGCHSIRVNAHSGGSYDEQMKLAADGLRRLSEFGDEHGINVLVENHGGLSSNGAWLAGVMQQVDHPRCGTLPDFGNFNLGGGKTYNRYRGVEELMPFAKAVSAKSHDFDADGNEQHTDFGRMMKIVLDAGYHGYVGIEYEGGELPEEAGIAATKKLLERVRAELS